jgi:beta-galactosidase/beta-glucuronidase
MKKRTILLISILFAATAAFAQKDWAMIKGKIATPWAEKVAPANPLPEYPRPQMVRNTWMNLNGLWQYAILPKSAETVPTGYAGNILVPFAVESALSGVGKTVGKDSVLWYERTVTVPSSLRKNNVLLHFGAVDWQCDVFVNGKKVGTHQGGYDPFSFDISTALGKSGHRSARFFTI